MSPQDWTWTEFDRRIRPDGRPLLGKLPDFPDAVLVAGCQRSGTTLLGKVLAAADGFGHFEFAKFPELSAALVLVGEVDGELPGRAVFQTTYLDDRWPEYLEIQSRQRVIWVLRNPESVVTSMLYNWPAFAVNATVRRSGWDELSVGQRRWMRWFGGWAVPRIERACAIYRAKLAQLEELQSRMDAAQLSTIDYDHLVEEPIRVLDRLADFLDVPRGHFDASSIRRSSQKKAERLSGRQKALIAARCGAAYQRQCERLASAGVL